MNETFDPYHRWLGIPPKAQPANHYRLLGLELFEEDPDVIRDAAEQRMAHVRSYQLSQHAALSQQVLNELAAARLCLLDRQRKATYDARLMAETGSLVLRGRDRLPKLAPPHTIAAFGRAAVPVEERTPTTSSDELESLFAGSKGLPDPSLASLMHGSNDLTDPGVALIPSGSSAQATFKPPTLPTMFPATAAPAGQAWQQATTGLRRPEGNPRLRSPGFFRRTVRQIDLMLLTAVGEENVFLHHFLRVLIVALPILVAGVVLSTIHRDAVGTDDPKLPPLKTQEYAKKSADPSSRNSPAAPSTPGPKVERKRPKEDAARKKAEEEARRRASETAGSMTVDLGGSVKIDLVRIPAGEFMMGSSTGGGSDEHPQHCVQITKPFYLGKYEVTQAQWQAVMGNNPSQFIAPQNPVERVSWEDCQTFIGNLNKKFAPSGKKFSLPTEAQWEYACRAGSTQKYCFGDDESQLGDYAWCATISGGPGSRMTHPVGEKKANAWGLYDMHGNVWEWCADWHAESYYANSPTDDPTGASVGTDRVYRGGSWSYLAEPCRSASRYHYVPMLRFSDLGLRVSLVAVEHGNE